MRVLAFILAFNDAEVIEQAVDALRRQTRPPDAIVIVDNASSDGTLNRTFPDCVSVIRNPTNLGTSGAVRVGFTRALEQQFDWTWALDADSVPEPDALENLLGFFQHLSPTHQEQVCFLGCRVLNAGGEILHRPVILTRSTTEFVPLDVDAGYSQCDCFIWSGSLFRMAAVVKIGMPSADYFTDWSELEYGYRARNLGLTSYIVNSGVLHQDVGRPPGVVTRAWRFGPFAFAFHEISPLRCYYISRNVPYFWFYEYRPLHLRRVVRGIAHILMFPTGFALRPVSHRAQLIACMRGTWDGLTGHIERRY